MRKVLLGVLGVVALVTATFALSVGARAQTRQYGIEYVRVTPYAVYVPASQTAVQSRYGYRACLAATDQWKCREFRPTESSDAALRLALATLGNEGY
jgi:hypothetical protein